VILAAFKDYLPLGDLAKIIVVCLAVAVIAPCAAAVAIVGLDKRAQSTEHGTSPAAGQALIVVGVCVLAALVAAGLYALTA
jgi:hypothetical protein